MGWETRNGKSYYYRKERTGNRVRSVYIGSGLIGQLSAQTDEQGRAEKDAERRALRREIEKQDAIDSRIDAVCDLTERLVTAALIAAGFHQHKRQWRRKRDEKKR
ncbi:MAG TPA: hypothetical protein VN256_20265 [Pyrinomonadaceae bacterium]|nr:hypothetical protein [Pyrinomonadaceae bacterium]